MIDKEFLEKLAIKRQVNLENVLREYTQNLFLSHFYTLEGSENILFKGGTALKLVFESPLYSEDLDFTRPSQKATAVKPWMNALGRVILRSFSEGGFATEGVALRSLSEAPRGATPVKAWGSTGLENSRLYEHLLEDTMVWFAGSGVRLELIESKPTSSGHLSILRVRVLDRDLEIKNEVSFRKIGDSVGREAVVINPEYIPPYSAYILSSLDLVREKIEALLTRGKPRDFFDLYFILRSPALRQQLRLGEEQRAKILEMIGKQDRRILRTDLQDLLPRSFWPVISDLPSSLERELRRS